MRKIDVACAYVVVVGVLGERGGRGAGVWLGASKYLTPSAGRWWARPITQRANVFDTVIKI